MSCEMSTSMQKKSEEIVEGLDDKLGARKCNNSWVKSETETDAASSVTETDAAPKLSDEALSLEHKLYLAATKDDLKSFGLLFENVLTSPDNPFNPARISNNTLLHVATENGCARVTRLIAQRFPFLMAQKNSSRDTDTPFHIVTRYGDNSVFKALIEEYINSLPPNDEESQPNDGALQVQNKEGNTALHEALIHRRKSMSRHLAEICRKHEAFVLNNENKSDVYLAVEAGYKKCVETLLAKAEDDDVRLQKTASNGESVLHAAAKGQNLDILEMITSKLPSLMILGDNKGMLPIHWAASAGHLKGVRHLLKKGNLDYITNDGDGLLPIHHASMKGHVDVVHELLKRIHDPSQYLNRRGQNILHLAAESGKCNVVNYILKHLLYKKFVNQKDNDGNTPLHLASSHSHPHIVSALTWDKRTQVKLRNNEGQTAIDVALKNRNGHISLRQRLTWAALKAAKTPIRRNSNQPEMTYMFKDRVNSLLLVAALVATVTFAAGFTMPGGYNSSEPDVGMPVMLKNMKFQIFVFCNTIAMYTATLVIVILMWGQLEDVHIVIASLERAIPLLGVALTMMCAAYLGGVYTVVSKLNWLANAVLISGCIFLVTIAGLFSLGLPLEYENRTFRFFAYYIICLTLWITNSYSKSEDEEGPPALEVKSLNWNMYVKLRRIAKKLRTKGDAASAASTYILEHLWSKKLVNQKDNDGNTPLHLASLHSHPHIVSALTWDKRTQVKLRNNKGHTALDVALHNKNDHISLRQRLTWAALKAAKTPIRRIIEPTSSNSNQPEITSMFKDRVNSLLVVAALVATVTFAAGFTMPGGYNSSEPDVGMPVMLNNMKFQIFVFFNTIAMYTATLVIVILMWAQLGDVHIVIASLEWGIPLLGVALTMMCVAYLSGVYTVVSKLNWLASVVLISGCIFLVTIAGLFFLLGLPMESENRTFRFFAYYIICLMLWITNSYSKSEDEEGPAALEVESRNWNMYAKLRRTAKKLRSKGH